MMAIGVSVVMYLRGDFKDEDFIMKEVNGMKVTLLHKKSRNQIVSEICDLTRAAAKALEKGYLKELHLLISPFEDKPEVLECYKFKFEAPAPALQSGLKGGHGDEDCNTPEFQAKAKQMLRNLLVAAQSGDVLPSEAYVSLRMVYHEDALIPKGYKPDGFAPCSDEDMKTKFFQSPAQKLTLGSTETLWHKTSMNMQ